jgi:hypothetical protein
LWAVISPEIEQLDLAVNGGATCPSPKIRPTNVVS